MPTKPLDQVPGLPLKGRLSRRAALQGSAAAALTLATGHSAEAETPAALPSPSRELLDLAARVAKLSGLCRATAEEQAALEDRVLGLCPPPTVLPQPSLRYPVQETVTPTALIVTVTQPFERDPVWVQWERDTEAAKRAHEEGERAAEEQVGLPKVRRLADRQEARLDRLASQLAGMSATTPAELAAKARTASALVGADALAREAEMARHADLILSVLRDSARLGGEA